MKLIMGGECVDRKYFFLDFMFTFSTCACGKWICTSKLCGSYNDVSSSYEKKSDDNVERQYDDMDNQID